MDPSDYDLSDPSRKRRNKAIPAWKRAADARIQAAAEGSYSPWPWLAERAANAPVWLAEQGLGGQLGSDKGNDATDMRMLELQKAIDTASRTGQVPQSPWLSIKY